MIVELDIKDFINGTWEFEIPKGAIIEGIRIGNKQDFGIDINTILNKGESHDK